MNKRDVMTEMDILFSKNIDIIRYLDNYINSNYQFMVLLKGEWGFGKTHFIKNYIEYKREKLKRKEIEKYIYISLSGIEKLEDIYNLFIENRYKVKKKVKLSFSILKSLTPLVNRVKNNFEIKDFTNFQIEESMVFIFDNIEEVSKKVDTFDLLSFINRVFIENCGAKVILLSSCYNLENNQYIGKSFLIKNTPQLAIDNFINSCNLDVKDLLINYKEIILELYNSSNFKNLNNIKNSILEFQFYYKNYKQFKADIDNFINDTNQIKLFLYIFFTLSIGVVDRESYSKVDIDYSLKISKNIFSSLDQYDIIYDETRSDIYIFLKTLFKNYKNRIYLINGITEYMVIKESLTPIENIVDNILKLKEKKSQIITILKGRVDFYEKK